ncbi:Nucleolar protein 6 [Sarcoptes scabiei]|nr:Nucleolar protein 6 [Sarcoptes scabiei]
MANFRLRTSFICLTLISIVIFCFGLRQPESIPVLPNYYPYPYDSPNYSGDHPSRINAYGNNLPNHYQQHRLPGPIPNPSSSCYDRLKRPLKCAPEFVNAAYHAPITATNTCGENGQSQYCFQTGAAGSQRKTCEVCDARNPISAHPPEYMIDVDQHDRNTWWQSETMMEGVKQVNITIPLAKAFEITYVRLLFYSPRAESFAIYKRTTENGSWIPFQYYSSNCQQTYNISDRSYTSQFDETKPMCTKEFSDISPLTGGNVVFTTLEGRPNATHFESNEQLQDFVTATEIRIVLDNMNTFGDEIFGDEQVLRSYYYAISDLSIGGICKCNGHANRCVVPASDNQNAGNRRLVCHCEHNTDGPDCERCLPFFNDQPWRRATTKNAYACQACNCNGRSNKCYFDEALWRRTGHGGHCVECSDDTDGPNCERCKENYYSDLDTNRCIACNCDPIGSMNLQCSSMGQCACKPGVTGARCDRCAPNYFDFGHNGCRPCGCRSEGSLDNVPQCDNKGKCQCKKNVEGEKCDRCKPGFFDLQLSNDLGCVSCFCYGHSTICDSSPGYSIYPIESTFNRDSERWIVKDKYGNDVAVQYNSLGQNIAASSSFHDNTLYFHAPYKFLEDKKYSYNRNLTFNLQISGGKGNLLSTIEDVIVEGNGIKISSPIFAQGNPLPTTRMQTYRFRLNEDISYGWSPQLNSRDFIALLANITSIKIKATYSDMGTGFLDEVMLETAISSPGSNQATWVETCTCPEGHAGQHCESCAAGYKHDPPRGGRAAKCVPCKCNKHGEYCDSESGRCSCKHNTAGDNCERCAPGYYGNALNGTENDCTVCPCPNGGECAILPDEQIACLRCPEGHGGRLCDKCVDGYKMREDLKCEKCDCNGNIDPNAIGNCNSMTGQCLKCTFNTWGNSCEKCLPGHYGSALSLPKGDCKACACNPFGTIPEENYFEYEEARRNGYLKHHFSTNNFFTCDRITGKCRCKPNVAGRQCDQCVDGYWDLDSNEGCKACNCNETGSENHLCDNYSGQCRCKPGVTGKHCDQCLPNYYGFGPNGCKKCDCDPIGSLEQQCDAVTGQCKCRENVEGKHCERCQENKYNKEAGCIDCPPCYTLVQESIAAHRLKVNGLKTLLDEIESNPLAVEDKNFEKQLNEVMRTVKRMLQDAKNAQVDDDSLVAQLEQIKNRIRKVQDTTKKIENQMNYINNQINHGTKNITNAQEIVNAAENDLNNARNHLENDGRRSLEKARMRAEKYGHQSERMSDIAREARLLADEHEREAERIINKFKEARNISETAYNLAKDAINTQKANKEELEALKDKLNEVKEQYQMTIKLSQDVHKDADKTEQDALALMTDVSNIIVPDLNSTRYKDEAMHIINQAKQAHDEADKILKTHEELLNSTGSRVKDAKQLFEDAERKQQTVDNLLARVDFAHNQTKEAVQTGDNILEDAKKTLATLKEFDTRVQASKDKAENAMARVPGIENDIDDVIRKSDEALNQLNLALTEAAHALDTARISEDNANYASKDSEKILDDARRTKNKVDDLNVQAAELLRDVDRTSEKMKNYETQAEEDANLVEDALKRANTAKTSALDAITKVQNATFSVDRILKDLNSMEDMDENNLSDLEQRLRDAERELKTADLDTRVHQLKKLNDEQKKWIHNYEDELAKLAADVANIAKIRQSLPDKCFRRNRLEP